MPSAVEGPTSSPQDAGSILNELAIGVEGVEELVEEDGWTEDEVEES